MRTTTAPPDLAPPAPAAAAADLDWADAPPAATDELSLAPLAHADRASTSALAPPRAPTEASRRMHEAFLKVNRWATGPVLRAGLGPWIGTPVGGYLLLLRAGGRTSGVVRETPLSYLIAEGAVWVCAGFGPATQWYRNVLVDPAVEVVLPGRTIAGIAEDVRDSDIRQRIVPALVRAVGMPGAFGGVDPRRATDEQILEAYGWVPLIRLRPTEGPLAAGPDDPGGTAWIWRQAVILGLCVLVARWKLGVVRSMLWRRGRRGG